MIEQIYQQEKKKKSIFILTFIQPNVFISFQGIFISRVNKGGASEKAGIHVGDRLLEVGGESFFSLLCS